MQEIYRGPVVDIEQARKNWQPRENRIFLPIRLNMEEIDELIRIADIYGVSDINFQVGDYVRFQINGRWVRVSSRTITTPDVDLLMRETYNTTGYSEVVQRGRPIDYAFVVKPFYKDADRKLRLRVNATGGRDPNTDSAQSSDGVQMTMRILPGVPPTLEERNIEQAIINQFNIERGLVWVTGPTGSGKTTLLGGGIRHIGENHDNAAKLIEYSAPIETVYDDLDFGETFVHQLEVGRALRLRPEEGGSNMVWAACVANAMRRKPDGILIGEARDGPTIEGCITAAMTGHRVYSTLHTSGVAETARRAIMALPPDQREAIAIDMMEMASMFMTQLLVPARKGGRIAVREYMVFDAKTRRAIVNAPLEKWTSLIQDMMIEGKCESQRMIDHAQRLFDAGEIEESEYHILAARQKGTKTAPIDPSAPIIGLGGSATEGFRPSLDQDIGLDALLVAGADNVDK